MKKLFLYVILGVTCFSVGYFAINEVVGTTDKAVYQEIATDKMAVKTSDKSNNNKVYINNVDISDLSYEDALKKLNDSINTEDEILTVNVEEQQFTSTFKQLGLSYNYESAIKEAQENINDDTISIKSKINYNVEEIYKIIETLKEMCDVPLINDEIKFDNDEFIVTTLNEGKVLNVETSAEQIKTALNNGEKTVTLQLDLVTNKEMLENINDYMVEIGSFTTKYAGSSNGRITNLQVAGSSLNGTYIYPGEVFSTNSNFAPYTREKGYRDGSIIVDGELVDGLGGGVCQVSSTLYNALLYAELDIIEKFNHSLKVGYIDYGFDAVLASTYKDLKFVNDTSKPVYIKSEVANGLVKVTIYGEEIHDPNRVIKFSNEHVNSVAPPEPVILENDEMYIGEEEVKVKPLYGQVYNVYKHIYNGEELVETQFIDKNVYKSRAEQRYVGIKEPENIEENILVENELNEVNENTIEEFEEDTLNDNGAIEEDILNGNVVEEESTVNDNEIEENLNIEEQNTSVSDTIVDNFNDEGLVANNEEIQEIIADNEDVQQIEDNASEEITNNN